MPISLAIPLAAGSDPAGDAESVERDDIIRRDPPRP
jgi:hypothetical protein